MEEKKKVTISKMGIILIIACFLVLVGIVTIIVLAVSKEEKGPQIITKVNEIVGYNYYLQDNDTTYISDTFYELKDILDNKESTDITIFEEEYAKVVSKLFVAKFYTLSNKLSSYDIGGVEFLNPFIKENFILKAKNTLYKYIEVNPDEHLNANLPTVIGVDVVSVKQENVSYANNEYTDDLAYKVEVSVTYEADLGYSNKVEVILVHNDNKIDIVAIKDITG